MSVIDFDQEWEFIEFEKKVLDKKSLEFELLNIAQVLLLNYENAKTEKTKNFYKTVYLKSKNFYAKEKE